MSEYLVKRVEEIIEKMRAKLDLDSLDGWDKEYLTDLLAQELKKSFKAGADSERRKPSRERSR